jgi:hypothetical protein
MARKRTLLPKFSSLAKEALGANQLNYPLNQRTGWQRRETGEHFRIGMKNPAPPNTRPPVGLFSLIKKGYTNNSEVVYT